MPKPIAHLSKWRNGAKCEEITTIPPPAAATPRSGNEKGEGASGAVACLKIEFNFVSQLDSRAVGIILSLDRAPGDE